MEIKIYYTKKQVHNYFLKVKGQRAKGKGLILMFSLQEFILNLIFEDV